MSETALPSQARAPLVRIVSDRSAGLGGIWPELHGFTMLAVLPMEILIGGFLRFPVLAPEDCTHDGIHSSLKSARFVHRVAFADITTAEFQGWIEIGRLRRSVSAGSDVTLCISDAGASYVVTLPRQEALNVHRALRQSLCDRMASEVRWNGPRLPATLIWLLLSGLGLFLCYVLRNEILVLPLLVATTCGFWYAGRRLLAWLKPPILEASALFADRRPTPYRHRHPIRSLFLGRTLKAIGIVWLAWCLIIGISFWSYDGLLLLPAIPLIYWGTSLSQRSAVQATAGDVRKPLLYLRSFSVDGKTTLQPYRRVADVLGVAGIIRPTALNRGLWSLPFRLLRKVQPAPLLRAIFAKPTDTTEQSLANFFESFGPVVAIGRPGERIAALGAYRDYVPDDKWQAKVLNYLQDAQAVLIQPSTSDGMAWELETVFRGFPHHKILFVFPEGWQHANDFEDLCTLLDPHLPEPLPRCVPYRMRPTFLWFERDGRPRWTELSYASRASWFLTGNAADLEYTLLPFILGLNGGDCIPPRAPREQPSNDVFAAFVGMGLGTVFYLFPPAFAFGIYALLILGTRVVDTISGRRRW